MDSRPPIHDYHSLLDAVRARIDELQISHATVEEISGLASGHIGKCLGPAPSKRFGLDALWLLLPALGLRVVLEQDLDAVRLMERRWEIRDELRRRAGMIRRKVTPEMRSKLMREIGAIGGSVVKRFTTTHEQRSRRQSRAAKKGWKTRRSRQSKPPAVRQVSMQASL